MKKKLLIVLPIVAFLSVGFYVTNVYLAKTTGSCLLGKCDNNPTKASLPSGEPGTYEFMSSNIVTDADKDNFKKDIMSLNGIKDVKFGSCCKGMSMSMVTIYYENDKITDTDVAKFVSDKNYLYTGKDCGKNGCDGKMEKKDKNKKDI